MSKVKDAFTFTGKKRKQFNNLSPNDKKSVMQTAIAAEVSNSFRDAVVRAIINGEMLRNDYLYQNFVKKIDQLSSDAGSEEYSELVKSLLSDIRMKQILYAKEREEVKEKEKQE